MTRAILTHVAAALLGMPAALAIEAAVREPPPPAECRDKVLEHYGSEECPHPQHRLSIVARERVCICPRGKKGPGP